MKRRIVTAYIDEVTGDTDYVSWRAALRRQHMAWGQLMHRDGRVILFNRRFRPIWQRLDDQPWVPANRKEDIKEMVEYGGAATFFYPDRLSSEMDSLAFEASMNAMRKRGVPLPDRRMMTEEKRSMKVFNG